jgi:hypothetical protein
MTEKHSKYWSSTPGYETVEGPSENWDRLALDREVCRKGRGLFSGHCTSSRHLHVTALSHNAECRERGQEEKSS